MNHCHAGLIPSELRKLAKILLTRRDRGVTSILTEEYGHRSLGGRKRGFQRLKPGGDDLELGRSHRSAI
jgi:hypothetical protein